MQFLTCMKIFANSISVGIPKPYTLNESVAQRIVGERERELESDHCRNMHQTMHSIIYSVENRYIKMIPGIYLWHTEHSVGKEAGFLLQVILDLHKILFGRPRISINHSDHYVLFVDH